MFTDRPIEKSENDVLDRAAFSRMIGDILMSTSKNESLCVGLMGPWGSGKTSVINMAIEHIESEKRTPHISVIRFEPWNFTTPDQVISQFFFQLAEFFGVDNSGKGKIGEAIANYAGGIETSAVSALLSVISPLGSLLAGLIKFGARRAGESLKNSEFQKKSIQKQKDDIQKLFENVEEKIIIVIDDIDRLTDEQIRCVFQLVTIVCKFPNISYLLSFDRSVVAKALDKAQDMRGEEFLDKVIQVPISMPLISKNKLFSIMSCHLAELISAFKIKKPDESKWQEYYGYCVEHLIETQRDVLRLCNGLNSKLIMMSNDVDFADLTVLTIIEQHEPLLHEWIIQHGTMLTGQLTYADVLDHGNSDQEKHKRKERYTQEIGTVLLHKDRFTAEFAIETLCILFPSFNRRIGGYHGGYSQDTLRKENSVGHPTKFDRYFSLNMEAGQISNVELLYIINEASVEEIAEKIFERDRQGVAVELFDEILARIRSLNLDRAKIIINSLQLTGDLLKSESSNGMFPRPASREAAYLINEMLLLLSDKDRCEILDEMISRMDESSLNIVSIIINRASVAHNRIMEDEKPDIYSKYPSLGSDDEYMRIERKYKEQVKNLREGMNAFQVISKPSFIHFYKRFPVGKTYIKQKIKTSPQSIVYYLDTTVGGWHRIGGKEIEEIEINDQYKEFVSKAEVNRAVQVLIESKEIMNLNIHQQRTAVAFLMSQKKEYSGNERLYMMDVDKRRKKLLDSMKPGDKPGASEGKE